MSRRVSLANSGAISSEELKHTQAQLDVAESSTEAARAAVAAAREQLTTSLLLTANTTPAEHPRVKRAAAEMRNWEHRAALHHAQLSEHLNGSNQVLTQTLSQSSAQGLSETQSLSLIDRLVSQQAFTMSVDDIFLATAVLFILMIPLVWISRRILRSDDGDGAGDGAAASAAH